MTYHTSLWAAAAAPASTSAAAGPASSSAAAIGSFSRNGDHLEGDCKRHCTTAAKQTGQLLAPCVVSSTQDAGSYFHSDDTVCADSCGTQMQHRDILTEQASRAGLPGAAGERASTATMWHVGMADVPEQAVCNITTSLQQEQVVVRDSSTKHAQQHHHYQQQQQHTTSDTQYMHTSRHNHMERQQQLIRLQGMRDELAATEQQCARLKALIAEAESRLGP